MASILFEIKVEGTKGFSDIGLKRPNGSQFNSLKQFRVTRMYLLNLRSNKYSEIYDFDESLNNSSQKIVLYSSDLGCYIDSNNSRKKMDFDEVYQNAQNSNTPSKVSTGTVAIRYGPDNDAQVKHYAPGNSVFNFTKEYNGWHFTTSPSPGWVKLDSKGNLILDSSTRSSISSGVFSNASFGTVAPFQNTVLVSTNTPVTLLNPKHPTPEFSGVGGKGSPSSNILYRNNSYKATSLIDINSNDNNGSIAKLVKASGIYNKEDIEWYEKFNRFGCIDPYNNVTTTKEYLFFTKPDLHLFDSDKIKLNPELSAIPIFVDAHLRYYPVFKQLQWSADTKNPFMNILSNSVQSTLDLPSINAEDITTSQNIYGTTISYRRGSYQSDEAHEFSLEFEDTKYLEIYMLFKLFDEYERRKTWGDITPPDGNYRYRKILHDQFSIYKFIVGEDGMQLLYWAKLTGVYPKSVPRDAFSDMSSSGGLRFPIQFKAQFVEDMDPRILVDFNKLVLPNLKRPNLPLYNSTISAPEPEWALCPFIVATDPQSHKINTGFNYYMYWKKA